MAAVQIYTTGGVTVGDDGESKFESLCEQLGVRPPWQACYFDPQTGVLIHIFTAKRIKQGSTTRKANNYYAAVSDSESAPSKLWDKLSETLTSKFEESSSPWKQVASTDLKSPLSDPNHITATVEISPTPTTIPERAIAWHLQETATSLEFAVGSPETIRSAVRMFDHCGASILYATELKPDQFETAGLRMQLGDDAGYVPINAATRERLTTAVESVAASRQNHHLESLSEHLGKIHTEIATGNIQPDEVIEVLLRSKDSQYDQPEPIDDEIVETYLATLAERRAMVASEATPGLFSAIESVSQSTTAHEHQFERSLTNRIDAIVEEIRDTIINQAASQFADTVEAELTAMLDANSYTNSELETAVARQLLNDQPERGFMTKLRELVGVNRSTPDQPEELTKTVERLRKRAETTVIPKVTETTGLSESEVESRFKSALCIDTNSINGRSEGQNG